METTTEQTILEQLRKPENRKRLKDFRWQLRKLAYIVDKDGELVRFRPNRAQQTLIDETHPRIIILKSRQLGATTYGVIAQFLRTLFTKHYRALFVAHQRGEAENILNNKLTVLWENFPLKFLYKLSTKNRGEFRVDFGDGSESFMRVAASGRSGTYDDVHITELSKMEKEERGKATELVRGTIPAVPFSGRITIESTAEDDFGLFHELFWEAWDRKGEPLPTQFKAYFFNWTYDEDEIAKYPVIDIRGRDFEKWFRERQARHKLTDAQISYYYQKWLELNRDFEALLQQYPTTPEEAFRSSGTKFFTPEFLDLQKTRDPIVVGDWSYYAKRDPTHTYVMGVDPSGGVGKDNAAIVVVDLTVGEVVAEYVSKWTSPRQLAFEAVAKARLYNQALLAVESNNHGLATLYECQNLGYGNLYRQTTFDRERNQERTTLGFRTDARTKPLVLNDLKHAIDTLALRIPSSKLLRELKSYQREQLDTVEVDPDLGNFDRVVATAIAWHLRTKSLPVRGKITAERYA